MTVGTTSRKSIIGLSPNVFFLGLVSLLTDMSSEMIFTLVPLFLANVFGATTTVIGLVGGLSDSTDAVFRIFSGWLSDRLGKRKALTLTGYGISTAAKPFMYIAGGWASVLGIRFGDRVGKGIRNSPRDALLAASLSEGQRGKGFGLHRAMDTTGAVLGLGAAALIIYHVQGGNLELSLSTYRWLVVVGVIPAVLSLLILLILVKEKPGKSPGSEYITALKAPQKGFSGRYKIFLGIVALFTLGNSSDFFIILRAHNIGSSVLDITLMLVVFNIVYAAISFPAGILSDRLGRRRVIVTGWAIYTLVYLGLATASHTWQIWALFAGYGIYYGVVEGVARAFVADLVPEARRGTAYGLYFGVTGLLLLPASLLGGWLWQAFSPAATFYTGAGFSFAAMIGMAVFLRK